MDKADVERALSRLANDRYDERAWTVVYRQLRPAVYAFAFRELAGDREAAKDVTQEVFLRLLKYARFDRFVDAAAFRSYMYVMARHAVYQFSKKRGRRESFEESMDTLEHLDSGQPSITTDESVLIQNLLSNALRELSDLDREALALQLAGYSLREIGEEIGASPGAVGVRLHRARERLRAHPSLRDLV